jgi:hypothetical protein
MAQRGLILDTSAVLAVMRRVPATILTSDPVDIGRLATGVMGVRVIAV